MYNQTNGYYKIKKELLALSRQTIQLGAQHIAYELRSFSVPKSIINYIRKEEK